MSKWNLLNGRYKCNYVHCSILDNRLSESKKILTVHFQNLRWKIQNMIVVIKRNVSQCTEHQQHAQQQFKFCVSQKGMILLKWEDRFFPRTNNLHLLEVTAEVGLWYGLFFDFLSWKLYVCFFKNKSIISKGTLLFWSHNLKYYFEFWNFHESLCYKSCSSQSYIPNRSWLPSLSLISFW